MFNRILYILGIIVLCSCASSSNLKIQKIDFSSFNNLNIDYGTLVIDNQFFNKIEAPYIDYYVPEKLGDLVRRWVNARFSLKNNNSVIVLKTTILKANTLAFPLNTDETIENLWNDQASLRIEMYIEAYIELLDQKGFQLAYCEVKAYKSKELGENISLAERDYQIQEMTKSLLYDFDRLAVDKVKDVFKDYVFNP